MTDFKTSSWLISEQDLLSKMSAEIGNDIDNDKITLSIDQMLLKFSYNPSSPSIYRVNDCLRSVKEKAYDPMIIAIGPFHRGKGHLKPMEHLKVRYLKQLVKDSSVEEYVNAIRAKENTARNCYAEKIDLKSDEFVEMLLLDGIFIIEFLREFYKVDREFGHVVSRDNPIFGFEHVVSQILRDLMLFENQIPLFILLELFKLSNKNHDQGKFIDLMWPLLSQTPILDSMPWAKADHLLGLVHCVRCFSFAQTRKSEAHFKIENINSATELKEAGIDFKKPNGETSWLDITFKNKTIYMPELEISDVTESWFRNMIAYEYYLPSTSPKYISDYAFFLHCLIHSSKDAELLRRYGVISNWLGGDVRVYELVDRLGTNVQTSVDFSYLGVFRRMNHHCRLRRNKWIAVLRRKHFNSPWTSISLVAAAVLLSVGMVQMLFAILSFYRN